MPEELTAEQAAARLQTADTLGMALGPGQPPAFMRALGERDDWTDLRVYGALIAVLTELFSRKGVHYLSGFFGPLERALRDSGADIGFAPADFRRFGPLLERQRPRVMTTVATPPDADGWCSLSLHAGGTIGELHRAGADPDRLLVVEVSDAYPRTFGLRRAASPRAARRRDRHPGAFDRRRRSRCPAVTRRPPTPTRRSRGTLSNSSRPARPCRRASARSPTRSPRCWPRGTAATTGCTARCSPTAACTCTRRARSPTRAKASTTASA